MDAPPPDAPDIGDGITASVRWASIALVGLTVLASAYTYEGPYRWLAELQLAIFGAYSVQITFLLTLIACSLLVLIATQLARRFRLLPTATVAQAASEKAFNADWNERVTRAQNPLILIALGGVAAFVGARDMWSAHRGRELQKLEVAQLERGARPTSTWLELSGALLSEGAVQAETNRQDRVYVPLVSDAWTPKAPLRAILKLRPDADPGATPYRGAVDTEDLPGLVRAEYERAGLEASDVVVLELGEKPDASKSSAHWLLGGGSIVVVVGAFAARRAFMRA